jgi:hypothetical protein
LNELVQSGRPLSSPAKQYISFFTQRDEQLQIRIGIVERQNKDMQDVLGRQKRNLSGKRQVIDGNHLMTCETMLRSVLVAEEVTKKRQQKKVGKSKKPKRQAKRVE